MPKNKCNPQPQTKGGLFMPYLKYGNWYIPNCTIQFPTEGEALEYIEENTKEE